MRGATKTAATAATPAARERMRAFLNAGGQTREVEGASGALISSTLDGLSAPTSSE